MQNEPSGSRFPLDNIDRTDAITGTTINADILVDDMNIFLFADSVNRTNCGTSRTINTAIIDPMSSHLSSPLQLNCC
jgi:hypothetical protein